MSSLRAFVSAPRPAAPRSLARNASSTARPGKFGEPSQESSPHSSDAYGRQTPSYPRLFAKSCSRIAFLAFSTANRSSRKSTASAARATKSSIKWSKRRSTKSPPSSVAQVLT
jgi:hypothetical protein